MSYWRFGLILRLLWVIVASICNNWYWELFFINSQPAVKPISKLVNAYLKLLKWTTLGSPVFALKEFVERQAAYAFKLLATDKTLCVPMYKQIQIYNKTLKRTLKKITFWDLGSIYNLEIRWTYLTTKKYYKSFTMITFEDITIQDLEKVDVIGFLNDENH